LVICHPDPEGGISRGGKEMRYIVCAVLLCAVLALAFNAASGEEYFVERKSATHFEEKVRIPLNYGRLVAVTRGDAGHYLWFESAEGTIRLVIMERGGRFQKGVLAIER